MTMMTTSAARAIAEFTLSSQPAVVTPALASERPTPASRASRLFLLPPEDIVRNLGIQSTRSRWDSYSSRPGYGITPERVWRHFRDAETGFPMEQCNLLEDISENDGHLTGLIDNRVDAFIGKEWLIRPGDELVEVSKLSAAVLQRAMMKTNYSEFFEHQVMAFWYGWAGTEAVWDFVDGWWVPVWFINMPAQRFVFDQMGDIRLSSDANRYPGDVLNPTWMVSRGRHRVIARAGAGRCATWWSTFKRMSVGDWIVFAEKFGIPIPIGIYEDRRASEETRRVVEQAVIDIGEAGQAVMSDAAKIVFADHTMRSGDASALHPSVVALCNQELSKLITGATLSVESGGNGSFAQAKVHENRGVSREVADAKRFARWFALSIGRMFNALNGLSHLVPPTAVIQVLPDTDLLTRARIASILANELGMELDDTQVRSDFGFRAPVVAAAAVKGTKKPDAGPPAAE